MLLLRLSPVIPFNAINYVIAGTKLSLRDYIFSLIGILPGTATYVFIGATAGSMIGFNDDDDDNGSANESHKIIQPVALGVGIILALAATLLLSYQSRLRLMDIVEKSEGADVVDIVASPPARELMSPIHRESSLASDIAKKSEASSCGGSRASSAPRYTSDSGLNSSSIPKASSYVDPEDLNVYM